MKSIYQKPLQKHFPGLKRSVLWERSILLRSTLTIQKRLHNLTCCFPRSFGKHFGEQSAGTEAGESGS